MFTVLDPLLEFTYHLLSSWRKFTLSIQSLLCMLFLFEWPPCQRSYMILMEVSQRTYDMIHYISGSFGYLYVCEIYVNLIWRLYLFIFNTFFLSLSHTPFAPCRLALAFLGYSYIKRWRWKFKVKVMAEVKIESPTWVQHLADSHPFHSMSIRHPIPELRLLKNLTKKFKSQGHGWGHSSKSQCGSNILSMHIPFALCQSSLPFLQHFIKKLTLKTQVQRQMTMMLHNYRPRKLHRTLNGIIPSSGFRGMGSAKSGPSAAWFGKFWTMGKPI